MRAAGLCLKPQIQFAECFGFVSVSVTSWIVLSFLDKRNDHEVTLTNTKLVFTKIDF
jgi:hypothetical protein